MAAPAVTTEPQSTPTPARKGPIAHKLEHSYLTAWLDRAEPDQQRDKLARRYVEAAERRNQMIRREPLIVAELKEVNKEIVRESGSKLDKALRRQHVLNAELSVIDDLRVEATQAFIEASIALGQLLERQTLQDHNAAVDEINSYRNERDKMNRLINALPKHPDHDKARARLAEIGETLAPVYQWRDACASATQIARSMQFDSAEAAQMLKRARKG